MVPPQGLSSAPMMLSTSLLPGAAMMSLKEQMAWPIAQCWWDDEDEEEEEEEEDDDEEEEEVEVDEVEEFTQVWEHD